MKPEKVLQLDKRVVTIMRAAGLLFPLSLAVVCFAYYAQVFTIDDGYRQVSLPLCIGFTLLALVQAVWSPYTKQKVSIYLYILVILAALFSTLVSGFPTLVFLGWTVLEAVTVVYFTNQRAVFTFLTMVASLYMWIWLNIDHHRRPEVIALYLSALGVGVLTSVLASMWRFASSSFEAIEEAHVKEDVEHSQLTSLVNSMADGVIAVDTEAKVVLYNAAALNVLDLNSSMQGKSLKRFITLVDKNQQPVNIIDLVLETKLANVSRDFRIKYKDGSFANLYLSIAPVHLGYGKKGSQGFVLLLRDITREKSLEEERDEFISVVSHELRTPIAISEGNISNAQLIAEKTGDMAQVKSSLEEAHSQILFLADMINDLATLSRAERGKLVLEVEPIDVEKLLHDLEHNYQPDAKAKGLSLESISPKQLAPLSSSKLYVREVLQNFITNAIKYTEKGSVTIAVSQTPKATIFEVRDTGIGISKSDQERVYDKFFRSEDFRTRQNGGTGLGLYVTMKLTRLLHADINLESELNKGSTFTITIPNVKPEEAQQESSTS